MYITKSLGLDLAEFVDTILRLHESQTASVPAF